MNFSQITIVASHAPILLNVIYAGVCYKTLENELKVFSWFIFLSGVVQFASLALWFAGKNNMPLLHFYVAAGFTSLAWFYKTILKGFVNAKIIGCITLLFLLFTGANSLFLQDIYTFNSNALTVESILVTVFALFTFIFLLNDIVKENSGHTITSLNWINYGLFIYYSSCLLLFYSGEIFTRLFSLAINQYTWIYHSFFSVIMYTCFLFGLWKRRRT